MEFSSVVYIFYKGIISQVLCGYDVQMNMSVFLMSESLSLRIVLSKLYIVLNTKTSVPVFYRITNYRYDFGWIWIKSRVR